MATLPLTINYYAILRDQRGLASETIEANAATPAELYDHLAARHGFTLGRERLRVAVNDEFTDWNIALVANDEVVFIPPVAGG
jgi:molybdopterin converting factor subunit 1